MDAKTGEIIFVAKGRGDTVASTFDLEKFSWKEFSASCLGIAADEAIREMVLKLNKINPLVGYMIRIEGEKAHIDLGTKSGVEKGQRFIDYSPIVIQFDF